MKQLLLSCSLIALCAFTPSSSASQAQAVLEQMHQKMESLTSHRYHLKLEERRLENTTHKAEMYISVKEHPLQVKAELLAPQEGILVEYNEQIDKHHAVITPQKWIPSVNFRRNIDGSLLRRGHYSIHETSLTYFDKLIQRAEQLLEQRGVYQQALYLKGMAQLEGQACFQIELIDPQYQLRWYRVKPGESLLSIAREQVLNPYKILELNAGLESYGVLNSGQEIRIPSSIGQRCVIWVDQHNYLPRQIEVYDEKGLFERYSFLDIQLHF